MKAADLMKKQAEREADLKILDSQRELEEAEVELQAVNEIFVDGAATNDFYSLKNTKKKKNYSL